MRLSMLLLVLAMISTGCLAVAAKAHAGFAGDDRAQGAQVGVSVAFGYAGERSTITESVGFVGGGVPQAAAAVDIDYTRLPARHDDHGIGWRVGLSNIPLVYGQPAAIVGGHVGSLLVVRDKSSSSGGGKGWFESRSRTLAVFGVDAMVGMTIRDDDPMNVERGVGGRVAITFEVMHLSRLE